MGTLLATPATRSRPVVDAAIGSLAEDAAAIARSWAAALVRSRPPQQIGQVPLDAIARAGPELCAAILRALESDAALDDLARVGGPALVAATAAESPGQTAADVETLRGAIWERLEPALAPAPTRVLADAADRLAAVCAAVLYAALSPASGVSADSSPAPTASPLAAESASPGAAVIVDEAGPVAPSARPSRRAGDTAAAEGTAAPAEPDGAEIFVHAAQSGEGPAAWVRLLGGQLDRHTSDGLPFSILLAELVQPTVPGLIAAAAPGVEAVLSRELAADIGTAPRRGVVSRQRPGRWWLLVPGVDHPDAERLAARLSDAAGAMRTPDGERVVLAVGSASCPSDGTTAAALAAFADVGLYAARALLRRRRDSGQPAY